MHPMILMTIVSFVGISLFTTGIGAMVGVLIALAVHRRTKKGASLGAIAGLILGLLLAVVFNIYSWSICAFCY